MRAYGSLDHWGFFLNRHKNNFCLRNCIRNHPLRNRYHSRLRCVKKHIKTKQDAYVIFVSSYINMRCIPHTCYWLKCYCGCHTFLVFQNSIFRSNHRYFLLCRLLIIINNQDYVYGKKRVQSFAAKPKYF